MARLQDASPSYIVGIVQSNHYITVTLLQGALQAHNKLN